MKRLYPILIILFLFACTKEETVTEDLAPEPAISFVSITPDTVENFKNSVTLTINYSDNNGDLGFEDPDNYALWVKDSRLDSADYYHVPPLAPVGQNLIINGQLDIVLNSMFILGNGQEERITLSIKIMDRAKNWSNMVNSTPITIKK